MSMSSLTSSAHYCLWEAAFATNLPITPFHHLNAQSLSDLLNRDLRSHERPLVLSDGVFPVSGEIAPVPDYLCLAKAKDGIVYLDDAHAVGVLGKNGGGTLEYFGIQDPDCRTSATLAKALGGYGGVIWGTKDWVNNIDRKLAHLCGRKPSSTSSSGCFCRGVANSS